MILFLNNFVYVDAPARPFLGISFEYQSNFLLISWLFLALICVQFVIRFVRCQCLDSLSFLLQFHEIVVKNKKAFFTWKIVFQIQLYIIIIC